MNHRCTESRDVLFHLLPKVVLTLYLINVTIEDSGFPRRYQCRPPLSFTNISFLITLMTESSAQLDEAASTNKLSLHGRWLGPLFSVLLGCGLMTQTEMPGPAIATACIVVLMAGWWITEAIPLAATAMLPLALFPLTGVGEKVATAPVLNQQVTWDLDHPRFGAPLVLDIKSNGQRQGSGMMIEIHNQHGVVRSETSQTSVPLAYIRAAKPASLFEVTSQSYASKFVFLMMGGFLLGLAIERWNLHKRIALMTILTLGTQPRRLIGGFMATTAVLSMWISNTATTVVMLPIALSLIVLMREKNPQVDRIRLNNFAACLLLCIAYSASVGGLGTFLGTPTNLLFRDILDQNGIEISFGQWMAFGLPSAFIFLIIIWYLMTHVIFRISLPEFEGGRELIQSELRKLGPMSKPELTIAALFTITALLWITRSFFTKWAWLQEIYPNVIYIDDTIIAMTASLLLFVIPALGHPGKTLMDWKTANKLPWGVLLLFGGGLALASAVKTTGLGAIVCEAVTPSGATAILIIMFVVTTAMIFMTEVTSNTATAALILPLLVTLAGNLDVDPKLLLIPATLAASCAFMLPVATPPNAIVFAAGQTTIRQMVRAGFVLNLVSIVLLPLLTYIIGQLVFGF